MLALALSLLLASATTQAAPYQRKGLNQVSSQCKHDFSYTWDDGPYIYHNDILDTFNSVGGKTTFYLNGDNWGCIYDQENVDAIRASYEGGHLVAHHTWSHPYLTKISDAQIDIEIQRLDEAFIKILGVRPKIFRPPFGDINDHVASYIQSKYGKTIVLWDADSEDSLGASAQHSYDFYHGFAAAGPGSPHLTLSHEVQKTAIDAMHNGTVRELAAAGINLVTTAECLDTDPYEVVTGVYGTRDSTWFCGGTWKPTLPITSTTSKASTTSTSTKTTSTSTKTTSTSTKTTSTSTKTTSTSTRTTSTSTKPTTTSTKTSTSSAANRPNPAPTTTSTKTTSTTPAPTSTTSKKTSTTTSTSSTVAPAPSSKCKITYVPKRGETCVDIGLKLHLSYSNIWRLWSEYGTCTNIWKHSPLIINKC